MGNHKFKVHRANFESRFFTVDFGAEFKLFGLACRTTWFDHLPFRTQK